MPQSYLIRDTLLSGADVSAGWVYIDAGQIVQVGEGAAPDIADATVIDGQSAIVTMPGFIDTHVHGGVGYDTMDATPDALEHMARFFAQHGVTGFLATTITNDGEGTTQALENAAASMGAIGASIGGAELLGVHLEGPYININAKGAQPGEHVRRADPAEYLPWLDLGVIRKVTVAPEFPENQDFIRACVERGIIVSIGHTQATYEQMQAAVALGASQVTHVFNAMTGLHHRTPGTTGAALALDDLSCEIIADNVHVHPAIVKLVIAAKGLDRTILITDALRGTGMPDGVYDLGGQNFTMLENMARLADGVLAGSVLTMDVALNNIRRSTQLDHQHWWWLTSGTAARSLGLDSRKGRLAPGYDADLVVLEETPEGLRVALTMVSGQIVYSA